MNNNQSRRPYIFRAIRDWIVDCGWTPYILVNCNVPGVKVPVEFVNDGKIILNVSAQSTADYVETNEKVIFVTRFNGVTHHIMIPMDAIVGVYSKETGGGIVFDTDFGSAFSERDGQKTVTETIADPRHNPPLPETPPKKSKPHLTLVKNDNS